MLSLGGFLMLMLTDRSKRLSHFQTQVGEWIDEEKHLGRLTDYEETRLRYHVADEGEVADLGALFAVHVAITACKQTLIGPSGLWWAMAFSTGQWRWLLPTLIAPLARVAAIVWMGLWRHGGLLFFSALPDVGVLGAPLYLLRRRPELGGFILRALGRKLALRVPGFGERGSLCEMSGVAAVQVLIVDPARMLPMILFVGLIGILKHWLVVSGAALGLYCVAVLWSLITRQRGKSPIATHIFGSVAPSDLTPPPVWKAGLPKTY
jgi:hypothetical protein